MAIQRDATQGEVALKIFIKNHALYTALTSLLNCLLLFGISEATQAKLPEIVVTTPKFETTLQDTGQHLDVIDEEEIRLLGARSIDEILRRLSSVDVVQRSPFGVQSDIRLRGSGFEQVLVLVNGLRVNDPQTGHFHLDVPISVDEIQRIEVMSGGASALYGAGGFGGVINIVTKATSKPFISGGITVGERGYYELKTSAKAPQYRGIQLGVNINDQKSKGYRPNTDFHSTIYNASLTSGLLHIYGGYSDKAFGANSFYSLRYPMQWEHTKSGFLLSSIELKGSPFSFKPSLLYRYHSDYYVLDRYNHAFYKNTHRTNSLTLSLPLRYSLDKFDLITGYELYLDNIDSSRLGNHHKSAHSAFVSINNTMSKWTTKLDLRLDQYSGGIGNEVSPSLGMAYKVNNNLKLRLAGNRSFRLPSYTELYYTSPVHVSNPALRPERAWQIEGGVDLYSSRFIGALTVFKRWGRDLIDWLNLGSHWQSANIKKADLSGFTAQASFYLSRHSLKLDYTYLDQSNSATLPAYYQNYLRHKVNLLFLVEPFESLNTSINLSLNKKADRSPYTLLDLKVTKTLDKLPLKTTLFVEGRNLTNTNYENLQGLPMPGRWLFIGLEVTTK